MSIQTGHPECKHCQESAWQTETTVQDSHRTVELLECRSCGAVAVKLSLHDTPYLEYDGAAIE